jgi:hypothetical protein
VISDFRRKQPHILRPNHSKDGRLAIPNGEVRDARMCLTYPAFLFRDGRYQIVAQYSAILWGAALSAVNLQELKLASNVDISDLGVLHRAHRSFIATDRRTVTRQCRYCLGTRTRCGNLDTPAFFDMDFFG